MRAYKTVNDQYIEPISFTVPRRAESFQSDIFPPATGLKPAVSAKEWIDGKDGLPAKIDLESVYEGTAPKEIASDYKPAPVPAPVAAKPAPKAEPTPAPAPAAASPVFRSPPPSMKDQGASMSNMADKFRDDEPAEQEESSDDDSSFEQVQRPQARGAAPAAVAAAPPAKFEPAKPPSPVKAAAPVQQQAKPVSSPVTAQPPVSKLATSTPPSAAASSGVSPSAIESSLDQIKQLLEQQTKIISAQNEKIGQLTSEVDGLKRKVGSASGGGSQDQSERIRQLELELEAARGE